MSDEVIHQTGEGKDRHIIVDLREGKDRGSDTFTPIDRCWLPWFTFDLVLSFLPLYYLVLFYEETKLYSCLVDCVCSFAVSRDERRSYSADACIRHARTATGTGCLQA